MFKSIKSPRFLAISALLLAVMVGLTACGGQPAPAHAAQPTTSAANTPTQVSNSDTSTTTQAALDASNPAAPAKGTVSYSRDIAPLLQASCVSCHGGERTSRALDLKTYDSLMAGSQNGAVITSGDAANSMMVQAIQAGKMPKRGTKWTADQLQLLVDWVNAGAPNN